MKKVLNFINFKDHKKQLIGYIGCSLLTWLIALIVPYITGEYIDQLIALKSKEVIYIFSIIVLIVNIFNIVGNYFLNLFTAKLNTNLVFELSYKVYEHLKKAPMSFYRDMDSVYLVSKINDDSNTIISFFLNNCVEFVSQLLTILISTYILWKIDKIMALVICFFIPIYIVIYISYRKKVFTANYSFKEAQNAYFSKMTEQFSLIKFIKMHSLSGLFSWRLKTAYKVLYEKLIINVRVNYLFNNLNMIITLIANIIIISYSGFKIINNAMSIGEFTMISTYFSNLVGAANYYMSVGSSYQQTLVSVKRMTDLMSIKQEQNGEIRIDKVNDIQLKKLSFGYEKEQRLINDLNISLHKGNIYCIIGENGTGKSSLVNIIIGLNREYCGIVLYNGKDISKLDMYYMRNRQIAVCEQEPLLFVSTIKENITLDKESVDITSIEHLGNRLYLNSKICELEKGYEAKVVEGTKNLSGGEKQKISIIRSIMKNASVLIFDEPTSALDGESVSSFLELIQDIKKDRIIIIISHSKEVIQIADQIIDISEYK